MIPLFHDFKDKEVVIIGGGSVALRKAKRFVQEAAVTVVAESFVEGFDEVPCTCITKRVTELNIHEMITDAYLVIAATDSEEVNENIVTAANQRDILVNRVDQPNDIVVPSHIDGDHVSVAIATGGASPATTKHLRLELTPVIEEADAMAEIQMELREALKKEISDQQQRKQLLWKVMDSERVWEQLPNNQDKGLEIAREIIDIK